MAIIHRPTLHFAVLACLALACLALACLALACSAGAPALAREGGIRIVYAVPKDAAHEPLYRSLRDKRVLERIRDRLVGLRLPRVLTLTVKGCDGEVDASYEASDTTLTICYEYLAYIQDLGRSIPPAGVAEGLTPANYIVGPFLEVVLHELAHAIFDLKKVPILGREEDAADQVAAYTLLRLGKDEARRVIASVAVMYASEAKEAPPELKDFANEHSLPAQRFYNLMCIAYGSDRKTFGDFVEKGYLPAERAKLCEEEYRQVKYAFDRLVMPHLTEAGTPSR
ncbi:DUF4344 domain-containing metallopeptidase [Azospirillum canadense]|uniref:DUF4344 domain-containing metallopeptidase n=1 Tax=Azospirillum canadense TaxID=403962 RepID=UPI002225C53C|nr:DUF4344 domain-containing metallopeptidase [Azospirillum canadense]MCW2241235.1 hypothetical protein [Azospirillum canadense]